MLEIDLIRHVKVDGKPALYGCTDVAPIALENTRLLNYLISQQETSKAYQAIISSPLQRCQNLAREFADIYQLPLTVSDDLQEMNFGCFDGVPFDELPYDIASAKKTALKEVQGSNPEQSSKLHWSLLENFFQAPANITLPEGELLADFQQRVIPAWQQLIGQQITEQQVTIATEQNNAPKALQEALKAKSKSEPKPKARRVLVIAHGGVIRMILAHILQLDWQQASWYQNLQISYGSLTRVRVSQPFANMAVQQPSQQVSQPVSQQLLQQVTTIAIPLLEDPHDKK